MEGTEVDEASPAVSRSRGVKKQLKRWFITLMLWPFNTVPRVVVTPQPQNHSIVIPNCNLATIVNRNANI